MIVIVFGLPGTGKSFFAKKLGRVLQASYYNTDVVREHIQKKGNYTAEDKQRVYEELASLARDAIKKQQSVIVDGTFSKEQYRKFMAQIASEEKTEIFWIKTEADEATIRQRVSQNRPHSEADYEVYQKIRAEFEEVDTPHLILDSGQLSVEEMMEQTINYISLPHDSH